jgi:hypothetical protein
MELENCSNHPNYASMRCDFLAALHSVLLFGPAIRIRFPTDSESHVVALKDAIYGQRSERCGSVSAKGKSRQGMMGTRVESCIREMRQPYCQSASSATLTSSPGPPPFVFAC